MDYKYIEQLLERYWSAQTSLEEEAILRAFFSQDSIPEELLPYKSLFVYQQTETKTDILNDDFDRKILRHIDEPVEVKARVVSITQQLKPLFKAAAIVAIVLTLGNAAQVPFQQTHKAAPANAVSGCGKSARGIPVALGDSAATDTLRQGVQPEMPLIK